MRVSEKTKGRLLLCAILLCGLVVGFFGHELLRSNPAQSFWEEFRPVRISGNKFSLVRPLVAYETPEASALHEYASLKRLVQDAIDTHQKTGVIGDVSVYYRNLSTGRWIGVSQGTTYHPASLLKIPVMIAYFKEAESDPSLLAKRVVYKPTTGGNAFETPSTLMQEKTYTIDQLIEHMIVDSDNGATFTLIKLINEDVLKEVYTDIGIRDPGDNSAAYQISTKTYALFFRILYNATYLSPAYSQKALELLSRTTYRDGLVAEIPTSVVVAHKFGEHIGEGSTAEGVELHDCGIVYYPKDDYLLCVMTRATDLAPAESLIQDISKTVYDAESPETR